MAIKRDDLENLVARVDERTARLPKIEEHLAQLNGSVTDVYQKIAKTSEIALRAKENSTQAHKRIDKLFIAVLGADLALIGAIVSIIVIGR